MTKKLLLAYAIFSTPTRERGSDTKSLGRGVNQVHVLNVPRREGSLVHGPSRQHSDSLAGHALHRHDAVQRCPRRGYTGRRSSAQHSVVSARLRNIPSCKQYWAISHGILSDIITCASIYAIIYECTKIQAALTSPIIHTEVAHLAWTHGKSWRRC